MTTFTQRMIGAAKLDVHIYEEVEADRTAFRQAMGVVILSSVASGIGASGRGAPGLFGGMVAALLGWLIMAWLTYMIGTRLLPESQTHADWGELLRTTGFATSPGILRIFGVVPLLGTPILLVTSLWMLYAFVIAVRQALDYTSTWRAFTVCIAGWLAYVMIFLLLGGLLRG